MPIHDWIRVIPGIFHDFHHEWVAQLKHALNGGLLPPDYYALAEQMTGPLGPDVLTLRHPTERTPPTPPEPSGGVALAAAEPRVGYRVRSEAPLYAAKANGVVIRHRSGHRVIAIVEIVSPGNKASQHEDAWNPAPAAEKSTVSRVDDPYDSKSERVGDAPHGASLARP